MRWLLERILCFVQGSFKGKGQYTLVALLISQIMRLRCAGLPQSFFCNLVRSFSNNAVLSDTSLERVFFQSLSMSMQVSGIRLRVSHTEFPYVHVVVGGNFKTRKKKSTHNIHLQVT